MDIKEFNCWKHGEKLWHWWDYLNEDIYWRAVLLKVAVMLFLQFSLVSSF